MVLCAQIEAEPATAAQMTRLAVPTAAARRRAKRCTYSVLPRVMLSLGANLTQLRCSLFAVWFTSSTFRDGVNSSRAGAARRVADERFITAC